MEIYGHVLRASNDARVEGATVTLYRRDHLDRTIVATASTNENGRFQLVWDEGRRAPTEYQMSVSYEGRMVAVDSGAKRWSPNRTPRRWVLRVKLASVDRIDDLTPAAGSNASVRGEVRHANGRPFDPPVMKLFRRQLGVSTLITSTVTHPSTGGFLFDYTFAAGQDLFVTAEDGAGEVIARSELITNASADEQIDLVVEGSAYRGDPEYTQLHTALSGELSGADLDNLGLDDVKHLVRKYHLPATWVSAYLRAQHLAQSLDPSAEAIYGLLRQGMPYRKAQLFTLDEATLQAKLEDAADARQVSASVGAAAATAATQLRDQAVARVLAATTRGSIGEMLVKGAPGLSATQRQAFARRWLDGGGSTFWSDLAADAAFPVGADVDAARDAARQWTVTMGHPPMVAAYQAANPGADAADMARLEASDWETLMGAQVDGSDVDTPPWVEGASASERRAAYAEELVAHAERCYPTTAVMAQQARRDPTATEDLTVFFDNNPTFDFRNHRAEEFLLTADTTGVGDTVALQGRLQTQARLFRVTGDVSKRGDTMVALEAAGITSAHAIANKTKSQFQADMAASGMTDDELASIHASARVQSAFAMATYTKNLQTEGAPNSPYLPSIIDAASVTEIARYPEIFDTSGCECDDCVSMLSPSAYFVDLMHWMHGMDMFGGLSDRRPDVRLVELSCDNTHTAMPYADLAIEVFEVAVAGGDATVPTKTTRTTEELLAQPEYTVTEAYDTLAAARYPAAQLPYSHVQDQVDVTLDHLGVPFAELLDLFRVHGAPGAPTEHDVAAARLGASQDLVAALTSTTNNHTHWGYDDTSVSHPAYPAESVDWFVALRFVPELMVRSQIDDLERLRDILHSRYVQGPNETMGIVAADSLGCDVDQLYVGEVYDPLVTPATSPDAPAFVRLSIFLRLLRLTGLTPLQLDKALHAVGIEGPTSTLPTLDGDDLKALASFLAVGRAFPRTPVDEVASWFAPTLDVFADRDRDGAQAPLYDRRFLDPSVTDPSTSPFVLTPERDEIDVTAVGLLANHEAEIVAALSADAETVQKAAKHVAADLSLSGADALERNLDHVSRLVRKVSVAKAADLDVDDYMALVTATGESMEADADPESAERFLEALAALREAGLGMSEVRWVLGHHAAPSVQESLEDDAKRDLLGALRDDLVALGEDWPIPSEPTPDDLRRMLGQLVDDDAEAEVLFDIAAGESALTADEQEAKVAEHLAAYVDVAEVRTEVIDGTSRSFLTTALPKGVRQVQSRARVATAFASAFDLDVAHLEVLDDVPFVALGDQTIHQVFVSGGFLDAGGTSDDPYGDLTAEAFPDAFAVVELLTKIARLVQALDVDAAGLARWVRANDGIGSTAVEAVTPGVYADAFGDEELTIVGSLIDQSQGVSGFSDSDYLTGSVVPTGATPDRTVGVRFLRPSTTGTHSLVCRQDDSAGGIEISITGNTLSCRSYSASDQTVFSQSLSLSGTSVGDELWVFFLFGTEFGGTDTRSQMVLAESGTRNLTLGTVKVHTYIHDLDNPVYVGRSYTAGQAFGSALVQLTSWDGKLSQTQMQDVSDGTSSHSPDLAFFTSMSLPTPVVDLQLLDLAALPVAFESDGLSLRFAPLRRTLQWFGLASRVAGSTPGFADMTEALRDGALSSFLADLGQRTGASSDDLAALVQRHGDDGTDLVVTGLTDDMSVDIDGTTVTTASAPFGSATAALEALRDAINNDGTASTLVSATVLDSDGDDIVTSGNTGVCVRLTPAGSTLVDVSSADVGVHPRLYATAALDGLLRRMGALQTLGISAATVDTWAQAAPTQAVADAMRTTARQRFRSTTAWSKAFRPLRDEVRKRQQAALVGYLLAHDDVSSEEELYGKYLIDTQMDPCMMTSRLKQAIATVQLYIQRCFLGLEDGIELDEEAAERWTWMRQYRLWEANRKVFFYPENWLEPELRITRSPQFDDAASQLLEQEPTTERVEEVLAKYLEDFQSLANPQVLSLVREAKTDDNPERIHFFARDPANNKLMYRRLDARSYWTPWEPVDFEVHSDCIAPFVCNGRLYLIWLDVQLQIDPEDAAIADEDAADFDASTTGALVARYAELRSTGWTSATSIRAFPVVGAYQRDDNFYALRAHVFPGRDRVLVELRARSWHGAGSIDVEREYQKHTSIPVAQWMFYVGSQLVEVENDVTATDDFLMGKFSDPIPSSHGVGEGLPALFSSGYHGTVLTEPYGLLVVDDTGRGLDYELAESSIHLMKIAPEDDRLMLRRPPVWVHTSVEPMVVADTKRSFLVMPEALSADMPTYLNEFADGKNIGVDQGHVAALYQVGSASAEVTSDSVGVLVESDQESTGKVPGEFVAMAMHQPYVVEMLQQLRTAGVRGLFRPAEGSMHPDLAVQGIEDTDVFAGYLPSGGVTFVDPHPVDDITFAPNLAASFYNWEFFLHLPLMAVQQFRTAGKYQEAMDWLHLLFDPRRGPAEAWGIRALAAPDDAAVQEWVSQQNVVAVQDLLGPVREVNAWLENPFDPHHVAMLRPVAYKRKVLFTYVETILDWADARFAVDTLESLNEAVQLYVYAQSILGDRPVRTRSEVPKLAVAYADLESLDAMGNAMVAIEDLLPDLPATVGVQADVAPMPVFEYFCTPRNDMQSALFDRVEDRLYKIRNCMNIDGVTRTLPLFQPPIDPGAIVAALAGGASLGSALDTSPSLSYHRFQPMLQRAKELTGTVRGLGQGLLSALEKRDGEELSLVRQRHELVMSDAVTAIREAQIGEARQNLYAARQGKVLAIARRDYYQGLIDAGLLSLELDEEERNEKAYKRDRDASRAQVVASGLQSIPQVSVGVNAGSAFGGLHLGVAASIGGSLLSMKGAEHRYKAANASRKAGQKRREQDWKQQLTLANKEIRQHDEQITAAELRLQVAERELTNHRLQRRHSEEVFVFIKNKFTNRELYAWMTRELSRMYSDTYQLALETARKAEAAFRYELGDPTASFVRWTNWDGLRKGLLSGERLSRDLERMEMAYMDRDLREYEVTKHLSLAELDPFALLTLQQTGSCYIEIPEVAFDLDFPSHYFRRIKKLGVSMPCVASRYGSVNAMLKMTKSKVRVSTDVAGGYAEQADDDRFRTSYRVEQVALSGAQNASGVFEMSAGDGRYLPFERRGVVCSLQLELPGHTSLDPASISDVVFHLEYTAREAGGATFSTAVATDLDDALDALVDTYGVRKVISVKHDLPDAWHALMQPDAAASEVSVSFELDMSWLPYPLRSKAFDVAQLQVGLMGSPGSVSGPTVDITVASGPTPTTETLAAIADTPYAMGATVTPLDTLDASTSPSYTVTFSTAQIGNTGFGTGATPDRFDTEKLTDLVLVFDLTTATGA